MNDPGRRCNYSLKRYSPPERHYSNGSGKPEEQVNAKQLGLAIVLAAFAALNGYAFYAYGPMGFFSLVLANGATVAVVGDLVIALTMVAVWMSRDAAQRSVSVVPYLLLTVALGS